MNTSSDVAQLRYLRGRVFNRLQKGTWHHLLAQSENEWVYLICCRPFCVMEGEGSCMIMRRERVPFTLLFLLFFAGCGEPMYDNNGSQHSLLEDREACAMEIDQSPAALAYRQNPSAHPDYPNQIFDEMNRCIERKGWKQVGSPQEQEQTRDAVAAQVTRTAPSVSIKDPQAIQTFVQAVEDTLVRSSSSVPSGVEKD